MSKEDKLSLLFKLDRIKDGIMYDVLSVADDRTNLLKNALFYYIYEIEKGKTIDRSYPYNKINIRLDIVDNDVSKEDDIEEITKTEKVVETKEMISNEYEDIEFDNDNADIDF